MKAYFQASYILHDELSQYFTHHQCDEHKFYVHVLLCAPCELAVQLIAFSPINSLIFNIRLRQESWSLFRGGFYCANELSNLFH